MKGRKPNPAGLRSVQGVNKVNPGRENTDAPEVEPDGLGDPPESLSPEAQAWWKEHAPWWPGVSDRAEFAKLAEAEADAARFRKQCDEEGWTVKASTGTLQRHPASTLHHEARVYASKLAAAFGMNPSDRTRIKAPKPKKASPADEFRNVK